MIKIHLSSFQRYGQVLRINQAAAAAGGYRVTQKNQFEKEGTKHRTHSSSLLIRQPRHLFFRKNSNRTVFAQY